VFFIAELWAAVFGMQSLGAVVRSLKGTELTVVVMASFGAGNIIQEAGNELLTLIRGKRFFRQARDAFWVTAEADAVRSKIKAEGPCELAAVDTAFEYCLTRISGLFVKRDIFLAISDFSRSLWLLSLFFLFPLARAVHSVDSGRRYHLAIWGLLSASFTGWLSWKRMVRFRGMTETPVFSTFLACAPLEVGKKSEEKSGKDEAE